MWNDGFKNASIEGFICQLRVPNATAMAVIAESGLRAVINARDDELTFNVDFKVASLYTLFPSLSIGQIIRLKLGTDSGFDASESCGIILGR